MASITASERVFQAIDIQVHLTPHRACGSGFDRYIRFFGNGKQKRAKAEAVALGRTDPCCQSVRGLDLSLAIIKICLSSFRRESGTIDKCLHDYLSGFVGNSLEHPSGDIGFRRFRDLPHFLTQRYGFLDHSRIGRLRGCFRDGQLRRDSFGFCHFSFSVHRNTSCAIPGCHVLGTDTSKVPWNTSQDNSPSGRMDELFI